MSGASRALVTFIKGDDPTLVGDRIRDLVDSMVGAADRSLLVDEFSGDEFELAAVADASQTPPFLTDFRIVLARNMERFTTADSVSPLLTYLGSPLESTSMILVWTGGGRVPKKLTDAIKAAGGEIVSAAVPGQAKAKRQWFDDQLAHSPVSLTAPAARMVSDQLGEDVNRLGSLLEMLAAIHGPDTKLGPDEIAPYLGQAGSVPPWDLTDAIDKGDLALAITNLHRMLGAGERHALQIMATLTTHFRRMLTLDGAAVGGEKDAAARLGMKGSTFPAKKALNQCRKLGSAKVGRSIELLGQADLDLRGATAWSPELVMEVLVARLAQLSR